MVCLRAVDCLLLTSKLLANGLSIIDTDIKQLKHKWPVGLMDKVSASGAGDSRFESWADQCTCAVIALFYKYTSKRSTMGAVPVRGSLTIPCAPLLSQPRRPAHER